MTILHSQFLSNVTMKKYTLNRMRLENYLLNFKNVDNYGHLLNWKLNSKEEP